MPVESWTCENDHDSQQDINKHADSQVGKHENNSKPIISNAAEFPVNCENDCITESNKQKCDESQMDNNSNDFAPDVIKTTEVLVCENDQYSEPNINKEAASRIRKTDYDSEPDEDINVTLQRFKEILHSEQQGRNSPSDVESFIDDDDNDKDYMPSKNDLNSTDSDQPMLSDHGDTKKKRKIQK